MTHEALPIIERLSLTKLEAVSIETLCSHSAQSTRGPLVTYCGKVGDGEVTLMTNGVSPVYEADGYSASESCLHLSSVRKSPTGEPIHVERVSVTPAAITTWEGIRLHDPDVVISAGTAGGVHSLGAIKRRVYLAQSPVK